MSLYQQLQGFYAEVHKCFKGRGAKDVAWDVIENAITATQDGGTYFCIKLDEDSKVIVDEVKLQAVLEKYEMFHGEVSK